MGINIGIYELESESSLCKTAKTTIRRVKVEDISTFEDIAEYDSVVSLEDAKSVMTDWEDFLKRNRINAETDAIYMEKIKKDEDGVALSKFVKKICTGWVNLNGLDEKKSLEVINASKPENRVTEWTLFSFDEMNETCAKCPLSWDKGRGCIGAFGPDNSLLPGIADKYGCEIVASAPASAASGKRFGPEDGAKLLEEVEKLVTVLPDEGKMMVRRYSGPLERLGAVAKISVDEKCGFFFF